ncbi:MAG: hypothetical protein ACT4TC_18050 [Myxococcaceae bacterium]
MDTLKAEVGELIQLFETDLEGLKFPDLDANVLASALGRAKERHLKVAEAEAALHVALTAFEEEREVVLRKAQRALAYVRVYAENDEALIARIDALALSSKAHRPPPAERNAEAPRRRGRPKKVLGPELFSPAPSEPVAATQ